MVFDLKPQRNPAVACSTLVRPCDARLPNRARYLYECFAARERTERRERLLCALCVLWRQSSLVVALPRRKFLGQSSLWPNSNVSRQKSGRTNIENIDNGTLVWLDVPRSQGETKQKEAAMSNRDTNSTDDPNSSPGCGSFKVRKPVAPLELFKPNPKLPLREQLREVMRFKHYSPRTERTYWGWIHHFLRWARIHAPAASAAAPPPRTAAARPWRHPREMGAREVATTQICTHVMQQPGIGCAVRWMIDAPRYPRMNPIKPRSASTN
jgi:hypothetical protein